MPNPSANILHRDVIRRLSSDRAYERGVAYFEEGRIRELTRQEGAIRASVKGASEYLVRIRVHQESLAYHCSCPQGQDRAFCKHAVALGLAWVARAAAPADSVGRASVRRALEGLTRPALLALLCGLADEDDRIRERILQL